MFEDQETTIFISTFIKYALIGAGASYIIFNSLSSYFEVIASI